MLFTEGQDTTDKRALLATLMDWTTDANIIAAMVRVGAANGEGLWQLAQHVLATVEDLDRSKLVDGDERPVELPTVAAQVLGEREIAQALLAFLTAELWQGGQPVRRLADPLAHYVKKRYGRRLEAAHADLRQLAVDLRDRHRISAAEIPRFVVDPTERLIMNGFKMVEAPAFSNPADTFSNPALRYRLKDGAVSVDGGLLSAWRREPFHIDAGMRRFLCGLPEELRALAARYPPDCLVRSEMDIICPPKGQLAIVSGYGIEQESGLPVVLVAASDDPDAKTANADPSWLELVCCRGDVTTRTVRRALKSAGTLDSAGSPLPEYVS